MYWTENSQCLSKKVLSCKGRECSVKHILNIKWQYGSSKWTSKIFKISDENYNNWKWAMYVLEQVLCPWLFINLCTVNLIAYDVSVIIGLGICIV